jgi:hypothetical protein
VFSIVASSLRDLRRGIVMQPLVEPPEESGRAAYRWFMACWIFIGLVSVHDAYLAVLYEPELAQLERNPVGRWLLELAGGGAWMLVAAKALGTLIACSALLWLYGHDKRRAMVVVAVLAALQLALLIYLSTDWQGLYFWGLWRGYWQ